MNASTHEYQSPRIPLLARDLREVQIELTSKCNADCPFCINRASWASEGRHTNGLSSDEWKRTLDWIAEAGVGRVRFSGGEPLLRKDIGELFAHAKALGLATVINTNGFLVDKYADVLYDYADAILISIISTDAQRTDEAMKAKRSYEKKVQALDLLSEHPGVWTSTVIGKTALSEFDELYAFMKAHAVNYWLLLRPEGNGLEQSDYAIQREQIAETLKKIREVEDREGELIGIGNAVPLCAYDTPYLQRVVERSDGAFASEGRTKLSITPYGKVLPSYGIDEPIGEIFDDMNELWNHSFARWIRSANAMPSHCQSCEILPNCHGGSRIAAKEAFGDWDAPDPLMLPLPDVARRRLQVV